MSKKKANIGFIDVLTGFLSASIFLMAMVRPGLNEYEDVAGPPREYLLYKMTLSASDPNYNLDSLKLKLIIRLGDTTKIQKLDLDHAGYAYRNEAFFEWENDPGQQVFAWGPTKDQRSGTNRLSSDSLSYYLYSVARENIDLSQIEVGVLLYDYRGLELAGALLAERLKTDIYIKHHISTLQAPSISSFDTVRLGEYSFLRRQ